MVNGPSGWRLAPNARSRSWRLDHREQVVGVVGLVEHELHLGALDGEPGEDAREDLGADALHQADRAGVPALPRATSSTSVAATPSVASTVWACSRRSAPAAVSRTGSRPAGPVEHRRAGDPLEGGDLLAHRRLRVAERLGRLSEGAGFGDGDEGLEVTYFDVHAPEYQRC